MARADPRLHRAGMLIMIMLSREHTWGTGPDVSAVELLPQ